MSYQETLLLFGIAINEIAHGVTEAVDKCLYVDDLMICRAEKTVGSATRTLQEAITKICDNANAIGYVLSEEKTKAVHFCRLRKPHYDPVLIMKGRIIGVSQEIKFLGLTFDRELRWSKHLQNIATKCRQSLNIVRVLAHHRWGAHPKTLLDVYKALILSKMDYGCSAYVTCDDNTKLGKLDKIQNLAIRYSLGAFPTSPVASLQVEANILPLALRRKQIVVNYYLKVLSDEQHPNYNWMTDTTLRARLNRCRSLGVRAREELTYLQLVDVDVADMNITPRRALVKARVYESWRDKWARSDLFLKRAKPELGPLFFYNEMRRFNLIKIYRLRLGHTELTHKYLLEGTERPICTTCNVNLTPEHVLCICPEYNEARNTFQVSEIWEANFNDDVGCRRVLEFLQSVDVLNKL